MRRPEFIARQSGAPRGFIGRLIARVMSVETAAENRAALDLLALRRRDHVLEIGFGHGRTLRQAAELTPEGHAAGVDVSADMIRMARRRCRYLLAAGRVTLHQGDVERLPFPDRHFDKAYSVHTLYFWAQPSVALSEIRRVLRVPGTLVLAFRTKDDPHAASFPARIYRFYSREEVVAMLEESGFECRREATVGGQIVLLGADCSS